MSRTLRWRWLPSLLLATACAQDDGPARPPDGLAAAATPIVNGTADKTHTAVGALDLGGGLCTGTLIAPRVVLTAAHCFDQGGASSFILGTSIYASDRVVIPVSKSIPHPQYDAYVEEGSAAVGWHDIAVAILSKDAPVAPVPYRTATLKGAEGSVVTFVGYGENKTGYRYMTQGTVGAVWTQGWWNFVSSQYPGNTCSGDSGGPAFLKVNGVEEVVGVTSSGDEYCSRDGYNTRVDVNVAFLGDVLAQYGGGTVTKCGNGACDAGEATTCPSDCGGGDDELWGPCGANYACPGSQVCVGTGDGNFCTVECADPNGGTGCPGGFACYETTDGGGVCAPGSGAGGDDDLWGPCGDNYSCPDGQGCVGTSDGNRCTVGCDDPEGYTGCPSGFLCYPTQDGGGVCVPSGTTCGDGLCGLGETRTSCAGDCDRDCDGLDEAGCCDGAVVTWCEEGLVKQYDCGQTACGWNTDGWYDCTGSATPDPSGGHPRACGAAPQGDDGPLLPDAGPVFPDAGPLTPDAGPTLQDDLGTGGQDAFDRPDAGTGADAQEPAPGDDVVPGQEPVAKAAGGGCSAGSSAAPALPWLLLLFPGWMLRRRFAL